MKKVFSVMVAAGFILSQQISLAIAAEGGGVSETPDGYTNFSKTHATPVASAPIEEGLLSEIKSQISATNVADMKTMTRNLKHKKAFVKKTANRVVFARGAGVERQEIVQLDNTQQFSQQKEQQEVDALIGKLDTNNSQSFISEEEALVLGGTSNSNVSNMSSKTAGTGMSASNGSGKGSGKGPGSGTGMSASNGSGKGSGKSPGSGTGTSASNGSGSGPGSGTGTRGSGNSPPPHHTVASCSGICLHIVSPTGNTINAGVTSNGQITASTSRSPKGEIGLKTDTNGPLGKATTATTTNLNTGNTVISESTSGPIGPSHSSSHFNILKVFASIMSPHSVPHGPVHSIVKK